MKREANGIPEYFYEQEKRPYRWDTTLALDLTKLSEQDKQKVLFLTHSAKCGLGELNKVFAKLRDNGFSAKISRVNEAFTGEQLIVFRQTHPIDTHVCQIVKKD